MAFRTAVVVADSMARVTFPLFTRWVAAATKAPTAFPSAQMSATRVAASSGWRRLPVDRAPRAASALRSSGTFRWTCGCCARSSSHRRRSDHARSRAR
ncbi:hypothetical protein [Ornithinimicrobium kibberense]|uniref:hypothetical protein n=1 Tax=Ornithinimicrobium kibberense TaxID=282060 RepID=UPI00361F93BD